MGPSANEAPTSFEFYLPPPEEASKSVTLRHYITTRNFFALLLNKPIVGLTLYQALIDLQDRLESYMPKDVDCTGILIRYLAANGLHNVTNDPAAAAGLLAWSEDSQVYWREGWREGFVHCCGMFAELQGLPEFGDVSDASCKMLENSVRDLQARIESAEERLARFTFDNMWPQDSPKRDPGRVNHQQCAHFFRQFYEKQHKRWPPKQTQQNLGYWLTRDMVLYLQRDFGALYDYLVDRNIGWDEKSGSKEEPRGMVDNAGKAITESTTSHRSLGEILCHFDRKYKYPHIPHPHPLLPNPIPGNGNSTQKKEGLFSSRSKNVEDRINREYVEASNYRLLPKVITNNPLVEAFIRFEKTDMAGHADVREARLGRWTLLYGILQVLATVSVDTPNLFSKNGASYFLNPSLKGSPPWKTDSGNSLEAASPRGSYCWTTQQVLWNKMPK